MTILNVLNYKNEKVQLTNLESKVYESLKQSETMDNCYCDCAEEISDNTSISMKEIRGVIASLVKKGVVYVDELVSGCGEWVILFEDK